MQYIENDMDDLFRKAGENYPLQTGGADWNALQAKLAASAEEPAVHAPRKSNRRYLWLLLLLLPLAAIFYKGDQPRPAGRTGNGNAAPVTGNAGSNSPEGNSPERNKDKDIAASTLPNMGDTKDPGTGGSAFSAAHERQREAGPTENTNDGETLLHQAKKINASRFYPAHAVKNNNPGANARETETDTPADAAEKEGNGHTAGGEITPAANGEDEIPVDSTTAIRQPKPRDSVSINKPEVAAKTKPVKPANDKRGLYYGVLVGPDVSTIKSQKVTNAGYSAGGILGYRINRHWAVEAGIMWDQKKYYTNGEYFNKAGTNIPPNVTVHYLDGTCNMLEFPLAVRYDVSLRKNSLFFTGGFTSYVMKKEDYNYEADNNGNYYDGFRSYKNSGSSLFSNLQLSAGYNYNFSKTLSLRIEPYIKLPVKDIGIGKMPISSKGLYIGIFRNIR